MSFEICNKSIFDVKADAFCNTINCVGAMGAGIALEFKKRYPMMFVDYKVKCSKKEIKPGDCYVYRTKDVYLLGLAVKNDWKYWSTLEWMEQSLKSLKLVILENDIRSVNLPLIGGLNGRRGPYGKVPNMTPPPDRDEIKKLIQTQFQPFADKFNVQVRLCIPDEKIKDTASDKLAHQFFGI